MSPERRKSAQDFLEEGRFVFGQPVSFEKAFPQIAEVTVRTSSFGKPAGIYTRENFPGEFIPCRESLCFRGGFQIGSILHEMVAARQTSRKDSTICRGRLASPKGRRTYRDCGGFLEFDITIVYSAEGTEPR